MRAVICDRFEGIDALRLGDLPEPQHSPGTALVRVMAAGVNFADSLIVSGKYQAKPELPFAPGTEVSGIVEKVSDVANVNVGDRVAGYVGFGGFAEYATLLPGSILKLPDHVSFNEAAAIPVAYSTSYHALVDRAHLEPGAALLVLGAAGGVGLAAVQIGRHLGANVIAAVSSEAKEAAALEAGAHHVIRTDGVGLREGIANATGNQGVDVVYDPVGGAATEQALRSTRWKGRLLVVGFAAGEIPTIPLNLPLVKGSSILGVFAGRFFVEEPERAAENNLQIMELIADSTLRPVIQRAFPLSEGKAAMRWVVDRKAIGRVVINP